MTRKEFDEWLETVPVKGYPVPESQISWVQTRLVWEWIESCLR